MGGEVEREGVVSTNLELTAHVTEIVSCASVQPNRGVVQRHTVRIGVCSNEREGRFHVPRVDREKFREQSFEKTAPSPSKRVRSTTRIRCSQLTERGLHTLYLLTLSHRQQSLPCSSCYQPCPLSQSQPDPDCALLSFCQDWAEAWTLAGQ